MGACRSIAGRRRGACRVGRRAGAPAAGRPRGEGRLLGAARIGRRWRRRGGRVNSGGRRQDGGLPGWRVARRIGFGDGGLDEGVVPRCGRRAGPGVPCGGAADGPGRGPEPGGADRAGGASGVVGGVRVRAERPYDDADGGDGAVCRVEAPDFSGDGGAELHGPGGAGRAGDHGPHHQGVWGYRGGGACDRADVCGSAGGSRGWMGGSGGGSGSGRRGCS